MRQQDSGDGLNQARAVIFSKLLRPVMPAAGRGLIFLVSYVLFEVLLIIFAIGSGGTAERLFDIRALSDYSLFLLMALYAGAAALLFAGYGYVIAARYPASTLIYAMSVLPVAIAGSAIWFATFTSLIGAASDLAD